MGCTAPAPAAAAPMSCPAAAAAPSSAAAPLWDAQAKNSSKGKDKKLARKAVRGTRQQQKELGRRSR